MIRAALQAALEQALATIGVPAPASGVVVEPGRQREHGEFASPVAMQAAKAAGRPPRDVAERLRAALLADPPQHLVDIDVAGPGFLNFHLAPSWLHEVLTDVVEQGERFGTGTVLAGERINLEFVSANPTGPLHAGGGRWVAVGDAIANLLAAQGAEVHREYYLNDAGSQLDKFRDSLMARYEGVEPPEDGYHGAYLVEMATQLRAELGDAVSPADACEWGYRAVVRELRTDLARIGVEFDTWFSERTLHERGDVDDVLRVLAERGFTYEHEGATWFRSSDFGDTRDRVLIRSDGTTTYLCNDLAYHRDKLRRGWTHLIDIWGADHHGQVKSVRGGLRAVADVDGEPEILLGQLVKLVRDGVEVKLSKRAGTVVTLADILDEVDPDAARLTFLMQSIDTPLTFDLEVVTAQSMDNPVYYVQMAHARMASIGRRAREHGVTRSPLADVDLGRLDHEREHDLLRAMAQYPDVVTDAALTRAPHKITGWVRDFASRFHGFYHDCRVLTDDDELTQARLWLGEACRIVLADALSLLGVHAPDEMPRLDEA
ncbi:MAG TPA: arginine--tRNA ligase [Acidimicrobiia bacterium]|nr:arginine--tRNA ligase [Acidimicrobiia bacterium]